MWRFNTDNGMRETSERRNNFTAIKQYKMKPKSPTFARTGRTWGTPFKT